MKKKLFIILPLFAVTLSGCSFLRQLFFGEEPTPEQKEIIFPDPVIEEDIPGRQIVKGVSPLLSDSLATLGKYVLKPNESGEAKLLIVPVQFVDSANKWDAFELEEIQKCFFGDPTIDTVLPWESVSSYYEKSSYGCLKIKGEVAPVFRSSLYTFSELQNATTHRNPDLDIVREFEDNASYNTLKKQYDSDGDGRIDAVAFIYSDMFTVSNTDKRWWAHVTWNRENPDVDEPVVNTYMWASYYFQKKTGNPYGAKYDYDTHTFIHESGHLLGLDDYYSYEDSNAYDPSGGQEMHSQNIGDENIFSKLSLGWVEPYYIKTDSSVTTTLNSSAHYKNGNCIIINDNWNMSPLDEYIILEYYTPTDLNKLDSETKYAENAQMFTTSGFRIYHVDSRLVKLDKTENYKGYVTDVSSFDSAYFYVVGPSNTPNSEHSYLNSDYEIENYKQIHLLQAGGVNTFKPAKEGRRGSKASNADLFKQGSSFVASSAFFANGDKFNNGSTVGYRIDIGTCTDTQGTVTITKI